MRAVLLTLIMCIGICLYSYAATDDSLTDFVNSPLQEITGNVTFQGNDSATDLVGGDLLIIDNSGLDNIDLGNLDDVQGALYIDSLPPIETDGWTADSPQDYLLGE